MMASDFTTLRGVVLAELGTVLGAVEPEQVNALRSALVTAPRVFVAGKGRSGLQARAFAMRLMHLGLSVFVVDEVTTPGVRAGDLLLIASGSGRTATLVQYAEQAAKIGANVALVTIQSDSLIARLAQIVVCIPAPSPKLESPNTAASVLPMGSLFEQALGLVFEILVVQLMHDLNLTSEQMFTRHANLE